MSHHEPSEEIEDVVNILSYFWGEKRDITCWVDYGEKKHLFPTVIKAVEDYQKAIDTVTASIYNLLSNEEDAG